MPHVRSLLALVALLLLLPFLAGSAPADDPAPPADAKLTKEELATLVGPVALYPDIVLASLLPATAAPLDVVDAGRALEKAGGTLAEVPAGVTWDLSVQAMIQYPDVLVWMNQNLEWVKQMGYAVAVQQSEVMAAVQEFRKTTEAAGNLKSDEHLTVSTEDAAEGSDTEVIVIEPTNPEVVYVPTYSPTEVVSSGYSGWGWGVGLAVGAAGAWAYHNLAWGNNGGNINVSNTINHGGNVNNVGANRPTQFSAQRPASRPTGGVARPSQPKAGTGKPGGRGSGVKPGGVGGVGGAGKPGGVGGAGGAGRPGGAGGPGGVGGAGGAGRPGGAGGARPTPAPNVGGAGGAGRPGGAGGAGGAGAARPKAAPSGGYGGVNKGSSTRAASDRGGSSMRGSSGGSSYKGQGGRSSGGGGGGGRSGGGGGGGGRGGGGGGGRRR